MCPKQRNSYYQFLKGKWLWSKIIGPEEEGGGRGGRGMDKRRRRKEESGSRGAEREEGEGRSCH